MKKILAKKKVRSAVRTANCRKKTHFSKKEKFSPSYQYSKRTVKIKGITSVYSGKVNSLHPNINVKSLPNVVFYYANRFLNQRQLYMKSVRRRAFLKNVIPVCQNKKVFWPKNCLAKKNKNSILSLRQLIYNSTPYVFKGNFFLVKWRKIASNYPSIGHRISIRKNRIARWKAQYCKEMNKSKKYFLRSKEDYIRLRAYNLALPKIIYRRKQKKLKRPVFYRGTRYKSRHLRKKEHQLLKYFQKKRKRYFNYYWEFRRHWRRLHRSKHLLVTYHMRRRKFRYYSFEAWYKERLLKEQVILKQTLPAPVTTSLFTQGNAIPHTLVTPAVIFKFSKMSISDFDWQKQKLYIVKTKASCPGLTRVNNSSTKINSTFYTTGNLNKGQRSFSTLTRLIPKRLPRIKRKFLWAMTKVRTKRTNVWLRSANRKNTSISLKKSQRILLISRRPFKKRHLSLRKLKTIKRRYGFKRWKFRFPKWRFRPRRYWNISKANNVNDWQFLDISTYRLYRRPHQPYRHRKPWATKKHKGLRLIYQKTQPGYLVEPRDRLILQQRYSQMYSKFYGDIKVNKIKERAAHFRRLSKTCCSKTAAALNWYESRLDVSLCRLKLAPTLKVANLLITQGYVRVNGTQIRTPEKRLFAWDVVQITLQSIFFFGKYWYSRNRYQRYLFKQRDNNFKHSFQHKAVLPYGFFTSSPRLSDLPRKDKISWGEFGRLLLI